MMSRMDYRALAEILATSATVAEVRERLTRYLIGDNARFDPYQFTRASEPRNTPDTRP